MMNTLSKKSVLAFLHVIIATQTLASAAFLLTPSSATQHHSELHRGFGKNTRKSRNIVSHKGASTATAVRGGARDDTQELKDHGGAVSGMFGNMRIPASLIAGASLGSAFALPFMNSDTIAIGFAKRMYVFSMITTLGSMLLVVVLSTIAMNDIVMRPSRLAKSVVDYMDENYVLEWMLVRCHFYYGTLAFILGSAFRTWTSVACPVLGRVIVGILSSLTMISMSYVVDKIRVQSGIPFRQSLALFVKTLMDKMKTTPLFGIGVVTWVTAVTYLLVKMPSMYFHMASK